MNVLTAYFSMKGETIAPGLKVVNLEKGHTAASAEAVQEAVGGDLFEMETVKTYRKDHFEMIREAKEELDAGDRPLLKALPEDFEKYDVVFLGYPNWYNTLPAPLMTFLESLDWKGKTVFPFNTSGGGGLGNSVDVIRKLCPEADVKDGMGFEGHEIEERLEEVKAWAENCLK